jgi:hypothetical protein
LVGADWRRLRSTGFAVSQLVAGKRRPFFFDPLRPQSANVQFRYTGAEEGDRRSVAPLPSPCHVARTGSDLRRGHPVPARFQPPLKELNAMTRNRAAFAIAILAGAVQPVVAGTYTLGFDSLAPLVGQVVNSVTEDGFTVEGYSGFGFEVVQTPNGVFPGYVSLLPLGNWTVTDSTNGSMFSSSQPAISVVLGGPLIDEPYNLQVTGYLAGVTQWEDTLTGEIELSPATTSITPGLAPVDSIFVHSGLPGQPYEVTEIIIQTAPEPPSIVLAAVGLVLLGCHALRSRCGSRLTSDQPGIPGHHSQLE